MCFSTIAYNLTFCAYMVSSGSSLYKYSQYVPAIDETMEEKMPYATAENMLVSWPVDWVEITHNPTSIKAPANHCGLENVCFRKYFASNMDHIIFRLATVIMKCDVNMLKA